MISPTTDFDLAWCERVQIDLNQLSMNLNSNLRSSLGMLNFLTSDYNTMASPFMLTQDGKYTSYNLYYKQRTIEADITEDTSGELHWCIDTINPTVPKKVPIDITDRFSVAKTYNPADLAGLCASNPMYFAQEVNEMLDALCRKINNRVISDYIANYGTFADGSTAKNVSLITGGTTPNVIGASIMSRQVALISAYTGVVPIIGGEDAWAFFDAANYACCNTTNGTDLAALVGQRYGFFFDVMWDGLAPDTVTAIVPGAARLLMANKYGGEMNDTVDRLRRTGGDAGTIMDPATGLEFSYKYVFNPECDTVSIELSTFAQLHTLPADLFQTGDPLEGVNGLLKFNIV